MPWAVQEGERHELRSVAQPQNGGDHSALEIERGHGEKVSLADSSASSDGGGGGSEDIEEQALRLAVKEIYEESASSLGLIMPRRSAWARLVLSSARHHRPRGMAWPS